MMVGLASLSTLVPAKGPASAVRLPASSTGQSTGSPYFLPVLKSSTPWPGAVCTRPVPVSVVM